MGQSALVSLLALALASCTPQTDTEPGGESVANAHVFASASLGPFDGHINAIAFAPVSTVPWEGRLVIAASGGGLKVIDVEGQQDSTWDGETITALATRADFNLRGLAATMVLALNNNGAVRSFIIDDARGQLIELPIIGLPSGGVSALCALDGDAATPAFLIAMADKNLGVWSISDTGEATLNAKETQTGKLAIAISNCAASGTEVVATGEKGGLFKLSFTNGVNMISGVESAPGQVSALTTKDTNIILVSDPAQGNLHVYDQNLQVLYDLKTPKALSTPGAAEPGALAVSARSFGGAGFSAGLLAVADDSTNRIALVVLDTIPASADTPEG